MTMLRNLQKVSFLGNLQGTKHCDISYKNLIYKSMIEYILSADCIYFSPSLVGRVGESPQKKERRLTTTIFTNLKSYTMKNTMQR